MKQGASCRVKPYVEGITKIRAHEAIAKCRPDFGDALD
jgi:hypothetical protein